MVVGDSLDATVRYEVEGAWGETDITISGFDLSIGERVTLSESVANNMWDGFKRILHSIMPSKDSNRGWLLQPALLRVRHHSLESRGWR